MKKILIAFGTRPEVIKLAPVIKALSGKFNITVLHTGQHFDLVEPLLSIFGISPDISLKIMQPNQDLFDLTKSLLPKLKKVMESERPDFVMVQGDTTTAYLTALSAFYHKIRILHVEAGLRSGNHYYPFPEEINRKQITQLADYHFAPTELNKSNLLAEGISETDIYVTGNTVIDALHLIQNSESFEQAKPDIILGIKPKQKVIVLTAHRRENHGKPLQNIFTAIHELLTKHPEIIVIFPAHPNPKIQEALKKTSVKNERFIETKPMDYLSFLHLLDRADIILSDSGGIQEEAATLGKPVLVLRDETERQELIDAGLGKLVGTKTSQIITETEALLNTNPSLKKSNVFGDGTASQQILEILLSNG